MTRSNSFKRLAGLIALVGALFFVGTAQAQQGVPEVMPYQGQLLQADGSPYAGVVSINVRLYERADAQMPIWQEQIDNVNVEDGKFYVYLGMTNPIVANVNDGQTRYLGISVNGEPEATPRQTVGSVPFAIYARNAAYLGGQPADVYVTLNELDARQYVDEQRVVELINENGGNGAGLDEDAVNALIDARNYVNGDTVNELIDARNYPSEERVIELINENAVNNNEGLNADQVNALIDARNYLDEAGIRVLIESYNYLTEAQVNALIDARNYLNADGVNALIDARNYLNEADIIALIDARIAANQVNVDQQINDLSQQIENLQNQINNINNNGGGFGVRGYILGRSAQTSNGRFSFNGVNGTQAADAMCQATFADEPTAHLCSVTEIERSLAANTYNQNGDINGTTTWTMGHLIQGNRFANSSAGNTCQNFMYNSADVATGQRVSISLNTQSPGNGGGVNGHIFNLQRDVACNNNMPVMCCR